MLTFLRLTCILFLLCIQLHSQVYNYAWMKGAPNTNAAVYGTMGISNPANTPGTQFHGVTWTDANGDLWLYGGQGYGNNGFGYLNDMWKYSTGTNNWTWISGSGTVGLSPVHGTLGVSSATTTPGGRGGSASWADGSGNLWLFGGIGANGVYNDLWRYNITNGQWTWMGGPTTTNQNPVYGTYQVPATTNIPRASTNLVSWKDPSGNFWLYDGYYGNEVWKYIPASGQWAWMSGASTSTAMSGSILTSYGTLNVYSSFSYPGERWTEGVADASGNLYVFGGKVYTATGFGRANDLWKYNISLNQWAWIGGTQSTSSSGSYGTQGTFAASNIPPSRFGHVLWMDNANNRMWLFGGEFLTLAYNYWLNDSWCYDINTGQWAWMKGSSTSFNSSNLGPGVVYGTQTIPAAANTPGWRTSATYWQTDQNSLWLFSGSEWTGSTELWRLNSCNVPSITISSTPTLLCAGSAATLIANGSAGTFSWSTGAQTNSIVVSPASSSIYSVTSTASVCFSAATYTLPVQTLSVVLQNSVNPLCNGKSFVLAGSAASSYSWNTGQTTPTIMVTPMVPTTYTLSTLTNGCALSATVAVNVVPSPTLSLAASASSVCAGQSITITASGAPVFNWNTGQNGLSIVVVPLSNTIYSVTGTAANGCTATSQYSVSVSFYPVLAISSSTVISCSGSIVTLNATGASTYSWNTGQTGSTVVVAPVTTTMYSVTGSNNGCNSVKSFTQLVKPLPIPVITALPAQVCDGSPVVLSASGANSYTWSSGQTVQSFSTILSTTTSYTVTGSINGCINTGTFTQLVFPLPNVTMNSAAASICKGETTTLTATGANTYSWTNVSANSQSVQVHPLFTTTYSVTGTDMNGCENSAVKTVSVSECLYVNEQSDEQYDIGIFPNPASQWIIIKGIEGATLEIYNALGQVVLKRDLQTALTKIDIQFVPGIYNCSITGTNNKTVKLIVE